MSDNDDLEARLSRLSMAPTPQDLARAGKTLLRHQQTRMQRPWAVRLNYALAATLLLSVGFNLLQFNRRTTMSNSPASQCEVEAQTTALLPENHELQLVLQDLQHLLPASTGMLC